MLLKLELSHQKICFGCLFRGFAGNISSCTQHSRRAAPLDPSPVMQSCAARLNARLTKQSVNCELLCIIDLSTFTQRVQTVLPRIFPSVSNDNVASFFVSHSTKNELPVASQSCSNIGLQQCFGLIDQMGCTVILGDQRTDACQMRLMLHHAIRMQGEQDDWSLRMHRSQNECCLKAVHYRHAKVQHNQVGFEVFSFLDGLCAIFSLSADFNPCGFKDYA